MRAARLPAALLLIALATAGPAAAEDAPVRRCVGVDGRKVFTDRRCEDAMPGGAADALPDAAAAAPRRAGDCADSGDDLRNRLVRAWRGGHLIELSGLFLWDGYGARAARLEIEALAAQVRQPLLAAEVVSFDAGSGELTIRSGGALETVTRRWRMQRTLGCWWLTP